MRPKFEANTVVLQISQIFRLAYDTPLAKQQLSELINDKKAKAGELQKL